MSSKQMSKKSQKAAKKVWRIYRYTPRFELKDDDRRCRKSAVQFVRDFVGVGAGNEAVGYHQQLAMLANGDGEEYCCCYGLYRLLIAEAGKRSRAYRGYLLDADHEPLSDAQLAKMFKMHAKKMTRLLRRLATVKLIERVDMPQWDLSLDDLPEKQSESDKEAGALEGKKRRSRSKKKADSGAGRRRTALDGDGAHRFKKNNNDNGNDNGKNEKATIGLAASGSQQINGNGKAADRQRKGLPAGRQGRTAASPATTPPLPTEPTGSDAGGTKVIPFTGEPPAAADYSRAGLAYGLRVYLALGYRYGTETAEARREICSFASKHDEVLRVLAGRAPPVIDGVLGRGLHEAAKIAKRKSARNRAAIWNSLMDKLASAKKQRSESTAM